MQEEYITLIRTEEIAENTFKYIFVKPESFSFEAGQYVVLEVTKPQFQDDRPAFRSLSIASAPQDEYLEFIMRGSDSAFKKSMGALAKGDGVTIKGPLGHMALPIDRTTPIVFLVAGVGITPARSMLLDAVHRQSKRSFVLVYSNRSPQTTACLTEMTDLDLAQYRSVFAMTKSCHGWNDVCHRVDVDFLREKVGNLEDPLYYIVGTKGFIAGMKNVLEELVVPQERIVIDNFG